MVQRSGVLIETYWNVKIVVSVIASLAVGINRNILECKAMSATGICAAISRINRNILECKGNVTGSASLYAIVLIETYWNVKVQEDGKPVQRGVWY